MKVPITPGVAVDLDDEDAKCLRKMLLIPGAYLFVDDYGYAIYSLGSRDEKVHRLVGYWMGIGHREPTVDHRDTNKMNCRRSNLRPATKKQQLWNRGPNKNHRGKYKGVEKHGKGWRPVMWIDGVLWRGKTAKTEDEAALAYNRKAVDVQGDFAWLNKVTGAPVN